MTSSAQDHATGTGLAPEILEPKTKKDVKRLSLFLPASLHLRARRYSMITDQTLTQLVTNLLSEYLDAQDREQRHGP